MCRTSPTVPTSRRLTALAMARALLAGPPSPAGYAARLRACLDTQAEWCEKLAHRAHALHRGRLPLRQLAGWIERQPAFLSAKPQPFVRRYLLRPGTPMRARPLGLDHCVLPAWTDARAVVEDLMSRPSTAGLWRLVRPSAWQRRLPLAGQHYRHRLCAKRQGGWRLLEVPEPHLMGVQRRLLRRLLDHVPPHEAACGFAPGRGLASHVQAHARQAVVLTFDLQDFFTSVRASRVHALFATLGYSGEIARDLAALCTTATPEPVLQRLRQEGGLEWARAQRLRDPHLPQGAPTSPALANLCAFRLDLRLDGLAHALGARYTRYADDLAFSGPASLASNFRRIEAWVGRIAREEGFALQHRKSRCRRASVRQEVCHVVVNARPNLRREDFDRLKAILHRCMLNGPAAENREGHADWRAHLRGRVAWAAQLNPDKAQRLERLYARIDWSR